MPFFSWIDLELIAWRIAARLIKLGGHDCVIGASALCRQDHRQTADWLAADAANDRTQLARGADAAIIATAAALTARQAISQLSQLFWHSLRESPGGSNPVHTVRPYLPRAGRAQAVPAIQDATAADPKTGSLQPARHREHAPVLGCVPATSIPASSTRRLAWRSKEPAFTSCRSLGAAPT